MKRWIGIVATVACLAAAVLVPQAGAHHQDLKDPDDTRGRFDLRFVHTWGSHASMGWQFTTFRPWTTEGVWDAGYFILNVDTFGSPRFDYYAMIRSNGRTMQGLLFRDHDSRRDYIVGRFKVWRPSERSVKFRFPWSKVRLPETRFVVRWNAESLLLNDACPNVCFDMVPDEGYITTQVRAVPEPTPTE